MKARSNTGFTLIELLVVIAVIAVLAALLFPALAVRMYADEHGDLLPGVLGYTNFPFDFLAYKERITDHVGRATLLSSNNSLFACPADVFHYELTTPNWAYDA